MTPYSNYVDQPGLFAAILAGGIQAYFQGDVLMVSDLTAAEAIVSAYDALPATQEAAILTVEAALLQKIAAGLAYAWTDSSGNSQTSVIPLDDGTQAKINRMVAIAVNTLTPPPGITMPAWPSTAEWSSQSGPMIQVYTPGAMLQLGAAVGHYIMALDQYAQNLATQIAGATTTSAVQTILSQAAWPTS